MSGRLVAVVGADGFVGGALAESFQATSVVYGSPRNGEIHISHAESVLKDADVIINAGGFRVRPGCTYADYQRSHQGATSVLASWVRKGALLIHISSASVLGKSKDQKLGSQALPDPRSFPSPAYAMAKLEADQFLQEAAAERDFRLVFLRPAVVYSLQGAGMVGTVLRHAKRGVRLRLYPRNARHHFCHMNLLVEVARRVLDQSNQVPHLSAFVVADPYTVSNQKLETMIQQQLPRKNITLPVPVHLLSTLLGHTFHSRSPKLDLRTWGEIFGILNLDTEYDPSETFRLLKIDPARYSLKKTLLPLIQEVLQK